jgi:hypothetical protein
MGTDDELGGLLQREEKYHREEIKRLRRRWNRMVIWGSPWLILCFGLVAGYVVSNTPRFGSASTAFERFFNSSAPLLFALGFLLLAIYSTLHTLVEQMEELLVIKRALLDDSKDDMWLNRKLLAQIRKRLEAL